MKQLMSAVLLISAMMVSKAYGQKVGHVSFQDLILELPEYKEAQAKFEAYRQGQESLLATFQSEYEKLAKEIQGIDPVKQKAQYEIKQGQIMDIQERGQAAQQSIQDSLTNKQNELMEPLQDKVTKAVEAVAKEKGYSHVINNAPGLLIFAKETENLDDAVRVKLGIKKP